MASSIDILFFVLRNFSFCCFSFVCEQKLPIKITHMQVITKPQHFFYLIIFDFLTFKRLIFRFHYSSILHVSAPSSLEERTIYTAICHPLFSVSNSALANSLQPPFMHIHLLLRVLSTNLVYRFSVSPVQAFKIDSAQNFLLSFPSASPQIDQKIQYTINGLRYRLGAAVATLEGRFAKRFSFPSMQSLHQHFCIVKLSTDPSLPFLSRNLNRGGV